MTGETEKGVRKGEGEEAREEEDGEWKGLGKELSRKGCLSGT